MLLATLNSVTAIVRNWPWHSTRPSRWALASKWSAASTNGDARLAGPDSSATRRPNSGWVLMPVPTAVPPTGNSQHRLDRPARPARPSSSNCRASPPISWPSVSGVASARCVRPILRTSCHCGGLFGQHFGSSGQGGDQLALDRHGRRPRGSPWGTCRWCSGPG